MLLSRAFKVPIPRGIAYQVFQQPKNKNPLSRHILPSAISVERSSGTTFRHPLRFALWLWRHIFSRRDIFGVKSDWFPVVYAIREAIAIVSQSFQVRRSSELLPRPWLNNLLVVLVVANCWSTPVLQYLLSRQHQQHQGLERVVCLVLSAMLNMGSSIFIPLVVFWPYYAAFLPEEFTFPLDLLYYGLWFIRLVMENQLLFSLSTADVFFKLIPHIGIFSALASAATLIRRKGDRRCSSVVATRASVVHKTVLIGASPPLSALRRAAASCSKQHLVHLVFIVWGFGLLALHLRAMTRPQKTVLGCDQVISPWFVTGYPYSTYSYNCYHQGTASPSDESWSHINEQNLLYLTISHCPVLQMPRRLQDFPNLIGVQLHNTTLIEWSKESAIAATKHTCMLILVIARTNMTGIPDGLLEPLPAVLMDIEFSHTNLTSLPSNLHEKWHLITTLYIEHSLITEFPSTLLYLQPPKVSLHGNLIAKLPELVDMHQYFYSLVLSANPLRMIPAIIGEGTSFSNFSAENTLLETLPTWTQSTIDDTMTSTERRTAAVGADERHCQQWRHVGVRDAGQSSG